MHATREAELPLVGMHQNTAAQTSCVKCHVRGWGLQASVQVAWCDVQGGLGAGI